MSNLIVLDRDGILNKLLTDSDGKPDSPMKVSQVEIFPWVPTALKQLNDMGFGLVIATNQPAWAKGKVELEALNQVHDYIVMRIQSKGAKILSSHVCLHRSEDLCACRKPNTGLLQEAFDKHPEFSSIGSWMVGDRATDVMAGDSFKLQTAWLGSPVSDDEKLLNEINLMPTYRGQNLKDFVEFIKTQLSSSF